MRTAKMFWRDMCLGTFRHGARFLIIPLVVVLMTAGFAEYAANLYEAGTIAGDRSRLWSNYRCSCSYGKKCRCSGTFYETFDD